MLACNNIDKFTQTNLLTRIEGDVLVTLEERTKQFLKEKKRKKKRGK